MQIVVQGSCFIPLFLIAVGVARKHTERQMFVGRSLMAVFFLYCGASILSGGALRTRQRVVCKDSYLDAESLCGCNR